MLIARLYANKMDAEHVASDHTDSSRPFPENGDQLLLLQSASCCGLFLAHAVASATENASPSKSPVPSLNHSSSSSSWQTIRLAGVYILFKRVH